MEKSKIYKKAQCVVVNSLHLCADDKLEILRELMEQEDIYKHIESKEEQKAVAQAV